MAVRFTAAYRAVHVTTDLSLHADLEADCLKGDKISLHQNVAFAPKFGLLIVSLGMLIMSLLVVDAVGGRFTAADVPTEDIRSATGDSTMVRSQTVPHFSLVPTSMQSLDMARGSVTFPFQMPTSVPTEFRLDRISHFWPSTFPDSARTNSGPHADFAEIRYVDAVGRWLEITQGYFPKYYGLYPNAPDSAKGTVKVQGRDAIWINASPMPGPIEMAARKPDIHEWSQGPTAVAWVTGIDGDTQRYYSVASDVLTLQQLVAIASSVTSY